MGKGRGGSFPNENTDVQPPRPSWSAARCPSCSRFRHLPRYEPPSFKDVFQQSTGGPGTCRITVRCKAEPWFPLFSPWKSPYGNLIRLRGSDMSWLRQSEVWISQWTAGHVSYLPSLQKDFSGNLRCLESGCSSSLLPRFGPWFRRNQS